MKIAIATVEKKDSGEVSGRGGRAPYYIIFDENGKLVEIVSNPFSVGGGGAGVSVAKMLADKDVDICVAGKIGANMVEALEERGVKYIEKTGEIKVALKEVLEPI